MNATKTKLGRLLKVTEVAEVMEVDRTSVYRMIAAGQIDWVDIAISDKTKHPRPRIRIPEHSVEAFVKRRMHPATR